MKKPLLLHLLFFTTSSLFSQDQFKIVKGLIMDNGETLIGQIIYENGNFLNGAITDVKGEFEVKLPKGKPSILKMDFCFSSFFYEVEPDVYFVKINMNKKAYRKSNRLKWKLKLLNK